MYAKIVGLLRNPPEFFKKAALSFVMRFGGLFLQFGGSIVVARALGAEGFGAFALASTWAVFVGMMLALGLGELSIREIPTYLAKGRKGPIVGYLTTTFSTIVVTGIIAAIVFAVLEKTELLVLAPGWKLVALVAFVHALVLTVSHTLNGFQRILTSQLLEAFGRQILYLLLIGSVLVAGYTLSPTKLFVITLAAAIPMLVAMIWVLSRAWVKQETGPALPEYNLKLWFAGAVPLLMTAFANRLQLDLDVLMVGSMLGDFEVGIYRAAARGAILVSIANMVALQLVGPMLSRSLANNDHDAAQGYLRQAALVSFVTGISICLIFGIGAKFYLGLYGPEFPAASRALRILLIGQATIALAGPDAILLIMLRRERLVMIVTTIGVAMNFILNYTLIEPYGIQGAAIASFVSMAFVRITLVSFILRTTRFNPTITSYFPAFSRRSG